MQRVIGHRTDRSGILEYLVKWKVLPYAEASWEQKAVLPLEAVASYNAASNRSAAEAAKETLGLRSLFSELGIASPGATALSVDNQSAIAVVYNPENHGRMKHVERRHFHIRECVENMQIVVPFVSTHENLADFFTKALPPKVFFEIRNRIMNHAS